MDRFWQWAWDRYGSRYVWVITIAAFASALPVYLIWSWIVLAVEKSSRYGAAAAVAVVVVLGMSLLTNLPGRHHFVAQNSGQLATRLIAQRRSRIRIPGAVLMPSERWRWYLLRW